MTLTPTKRWTSIWQKWDEPWLRYHQRWGSNETTCGCIISSSSLCWFHWVSLGRFLSSGSSERVCSNDIYRGAYFQYQVPNISVDGLLIPQDDFSLFNENHCKALLNKWHTALGGISKCLPRGPAARKPCQGFNVHTCQLSVLLISTTERGGSLRPDANSSQLVFSALFDRC